MMKNEVSERAGHEANARPIESVPQKDIYCAHRGHGCISQNGYLCFHGPKCEPMDSNGRRFVVFEWIEDGQRLATRRYLDTIVCAETGELAPVIDAEQANAALSLVQQLKPVVRA